jgi:chaperonin GroES
MFKPVNKKILFKPFKGNEKTQGGLYVPDSVRKLSNKGEIVEVGDRVTKVKKGDIGWRVQSWGEEIIMNGEQYFLMEEGAILALQ